VNFARTVEGKESSVGGGCVTYGSGGIQNLEHVAVVVDLDELTVGILDGGIVLKRQ